MHLYAGGSCIHIHVLRPDLAYPYPGQIDKSAKPCGKHIILSHMSSEQTLHLEQAAGRLVGIGHVPLHGAAQRHADAGTDAGHTPTLATPEKHQTKDTTDHGTTGRFEQPGFHVRDGRLRDLQLRHGGDVLQRRRGELCAPAGAATVVGRPFVAAFVGHIAARF